MTNILDLIGGKLTEEQVEKLLTIVNSEGKNVEINPDGTFETKIGHTYVVSSENEYILVTNSNGKILVDLDPAGQIGFVANTSFSKVSSLDCSITEVFKLAAPLTLSEGGIKTGNLLKYAECTTSNEMALLNPDYRNDLTKNGAWVYALPNLTSVPMTTSSTGQWWFYNSPIKSIDIELPILKTAQYMFRGSSLSNVKLSLPLVTTDQRSMFESCPIDFLYLNAPRLTNLCALLANTNGNLEEISTENLIVGNVTDLSFFARNATNLKRVFFSFNYVTNGFYTFEKDINLCVFDSELPKLSEGDGMFASCQLDKSSSLKVLNSIPSYTSGTHNITMGIHIDHQNDTEVLAAIENASSKGWTVTYQWNGTPTSTASTFGFTRIWVRKTVDEMGDYIDQNGDKIKVDYCDGISDPANSTPEDHGYEQFRSIEAAVEYWGLTPYIDPTLEEPTEN